MGDIGPARIRYDVLSEREPLPAQERPEPAAEPGTRAVAQVHAADVAPVLAPAD